MTRRSANRLPVVFHPTSVIVVLGAGPMLEELATGLAGEFLLEVFTDPQPAIERLAAAEEARQAAAGRLGDLSLESADEAAGAGGQQLRVVAPEAARLLGNSERFRQPSTVLAGARLPGLSGARFLAGLEAMPVQRLLIAGAADSGEVARAFEEGTIDGVLDSDLPDFLGHCAARLRRLQFQHFQDAGPLSLLARLSADLAFLGEPDFQAAFEALRRERGIVEHCLVPRPPGLLCATACGRLSFVLVVDEDGRRAAYEIAREEGAPYELLNLLSEDQLGLFPTEHGYYLRQIGSRWRPYVAAGRRLGEDRRWLWAVIDSPPLPALGREPIRSLADFRCAQAR